MRAPDCGSIFSTSAEIPLRFVQLPVRESILPMLKNLRGIGGSASAVAEACAWAAAEPPRDPAQTGA